MTDKFYEFFCPVKVIAGKAALEHIPYELSGLAAKRPMIITDKGFAPRACSIRWFPPAKKVASTS